MKRLAWAMLAVGVIGAASPASAKNKKPPDDDDDQSAAADDDSDAKPAKKADKTKKDAPDKKDAADKKDADKKSKKADKADKADAKADKADAKTTADDEDNTAGDDDDSTPKKKAKGGDDPDDDADFKKQDLTGHDLGTKKKTNEFEKDRFFVDKQDTDKTERGTLIQGSITSTTMIYTERGGGYTDNTGATAAGLDIGDSASNFSRMFTDLRLQTDFRHIAGGDWDARVDARIRLVKQPTDNSGTLPGTLESTPVRIQSGLTGGDEYDLRELWIVRNSGRSDIFFGRQFIPDLAGVKIDGIRIDYAQSNKFTLLGFGGLFPLRGSRSITTDYIQDYFIDSNGTRNSVGRFSGAGGFGAAYRTVNAYGSFGGVIEAPLGGGEQPRVFATSSGYWRYGTQLDLYHFAVIDLVGDEASATPFTNISVGANYKPSPRLRLTASFNRVDTETLSVQAGAFLNSPDNSLNYIDNETYVQRLATNEGRVSASAGLGQLERFELTGALSLKYRPTVTLEANGGGVTAPVPFVLNAEEGAEVFVSFTDRHSYKDMRLGLDFVQSFGLGSVAYEHTTVSGLRASAAHDFSDGRGEWEAEVAYTKTSDTDANVACSVTDLNTCFGDAVTSLVSVGGTLYYRLNRDWMLIGSAYITRMSLQHEIVTGVISDVPVLGLSGFFRIAYRF